LQALHFFTINWPVLGWSTELEQSPETKSKPTKVFWQNTQMCTHAGTHSNWNRNPHFLALTPTDFADCARLLLPASLENKAGEIGQQKLQI